MMREVVQRLKTQLSRLEHATDRLQRHERKLFENCVSALAAGDRARGTLYANECAEVRKILRLLLKSRLALEQILLRLETVENQGDLIATSPYIQAISAVRHTLASIIPEVAYELGQAEDELVDMLRKAYESTGLTPNLETEEAKRILAEADAVAEQRLRDRLPDIPEVR